MKEAGPEAKAAARTPKAALISDANVAEHYLEPAMESLRTAGLAATPLVVPPGDASKSLSQVGQLCDAMLRMGLDRGSVVVALGGGGVTDLAGFAAAIYMRGIAWIAVPTSLLAQVDASVGGKTAVNHPECKNLIGAFHQPAAVLCDTETLKTLPDEELRTGLAEVVKHAMIRDADLFDELERRADRILARDLSILEDIVARNVRIKAEVVAADEREADLRRILNYGHTIGHAIESLTGITHGRAVALGMMAEAHVARTRGLVGGAVVERQRKLIRRFGLPVALEEPLDAARCLQIMQHDKKAEAGRLRFVLPERIGAVRVVEDVTDDEIRSGLAALAET